MKCPVCNSPNPAGSRFCQSCGKPLEADKPASPAPNLVCPGCQAPVTQESRFCETCGYRLEAEVPASPQPAMQHAAPSPNPEYTPPVAPKPVNVTPSYPTQAAYTAHPLPAASLRDSPVSLGTWIGTLIILMIPFVNLIMLLVWALGPNVNRSLQNYCRALLLLGFIVTIISAILFLIILIIGNGRQW